MTTRTTLLLLAPAALALGGCPAPGALNSIPKAPDGTTGSIQTFGHDPAWQMELSENEFSFESTELGIRRSGKIPSGQGYTPEPNLYRMEGILVEFINGPCSAPQSGERFYYAIRVDMDGRSLKGCGGALLPPADLNGTRWRGQKRVVDVIPRSFDGELQFADGRITGSTGCNRFSGIYSVENDKLIVANLAITRMSCDGTRGRFERDLLTIFSEPADISFYRDGSLTLTHDLETSFGFYPVRD